VRLTTDGRPGLALLALALLAPGLIACGRGREVAAPAQQASSGPPAAAAADAPPAARATSNEALAPAPEATPLPEDLAPLLSKPFKGDLDAMVKRRLVRVLTVQSPILYFVDKGREVGMTYEAVMAFEKQLNQSLGNRTVLVHCVMVPVPRDQLIAGLLDGRGDVAAAMLTVTPERRKRVAFTRPLASGVREVLVNGPGTPPIESLEELSGREVFIRPSSAYAERIRKLNARLATLGKPPVSTDPAPETLEDGDVLEMVAAGLAPATVVDEVTADLYLQVFPTLRKNPGIASPPGEIAWAFRKGSPRLEKALNRFVEHNKQGTLAGNVVINRYLKAAQWIKNARSDEDRRRFEATIGTFKKYAKQFDLDYLLMVAQGYQESGLDQSKKSRAGALGVMQVLPSTARDKNVNVRDITTLEGNIHAGLKYNRWMMDNFYNEPGISRLDKMLFSFASYNAGPSRIAGLRREARKSGLDPNKWFYNVELVAARRIGRETVTYVANIQKYYLAYKMMLRAGEQREAAKAAAARRQKARAH
jgi:membrane-bound lytic murein transglycosylase MltF